MDLEQQLRAVLTDDRLDVHVAPGAVPAVHEAVRRRKRRNAVMASAASIALVVSGIGAGVAISQGGRDVVAPGQTNPTGSTSPRPPGQVPAPARNNAAIPWTAIGYDPSKPFALAGTTPATGVAWCDAKQVAVTATAFQGATGSAAGGLTVTNNGPTCGVQGSPDVTGYGDHDKAVATSTPADPFLVHPWVALQHGQRVTASVQIFGDAARCSLGPVRRLAVGLGHGSSATSVDVSWVTGGAVRPRCGTVAPDQQTDHYVVSSGDWSRPDHSTTLPMGDFSATIGQQPVTVMQGQTIHYQVLLSTGGKAIDPCLPYRERMVSLDGAQTPLATSYFLLDCAAITSTAAQSHLLDMQLALPGNIPPGTYALQWQTPIPGVGMDQSQSIRVIAAPPPCKQNQLDFSIGGSGAATGHVEQDIVIRNTSPHMCSLRGYPGVQFVNADGHPMQTTPHHGASFLWRTDSYETVRLAPDAVVSFALGGADRATGGSCPVATVVKIIAPGLVTQVPLDVNWQYCSGGKVDVSPVVPGARGPR